MEENKEEKSLSGVSTSKDNSKLVPIITLVLIAIVVFFGIKSLESGKVASTTPTPSSVPTITLAEISKHNKATDCWFAVEGNVYDVTSFIASNKHPGGDAILEGCGKDATVLFNTRPMGSGTPHSDRAKSMLAKLQIGTLSKE